MRRETAAYLLALALCGPAVSGADSGIAPAGSVEPGDPARGRAIVADRRVGLCLLCHAGPFPEVAMQGDLAPDLAGAGTRWTLDQLRSRLEDPERFVPGSLMPAFARRDGLWRVAPAWRGKALLSPQQIEDVAAFLATLRD